MGRESCIKVLQDVFERDTACVGITLTHEALEVVIEYLKEEPHQLTEVDLTELRHRFGNDVECVVRDMISGKEERWQNG